jgi:hypothetical protein
MMDTIIINSSQLGEFCGKIANIKRIRTMNPALFEAVDRNPEIGVGAP